MAEKKKAASTASKKAPAKKPVPAKAAENDSKKEEKKSARIISFYNRKGGTGKTSLSTSFAAAMARNKNCRVLVIDMDGQCDASKAFGLKSYDLSKDPSTYKNILNIPGIDIPKGTPNMPDGMKIKKVEDIKQLISRAPYFGLYVIPGNESIGTIWSSDRNLDNEYSVLLDALDSIRDLFDYIVIDLPPNDEIQTLNAIIASDYVLSVLNCNTSSVESAEKFLSQTLPSCKKVNPMLECLGLVVNRYKSSQRNVYAVEMRELADTYGVHLFNSRIRDSVAIDNCKNFDVIEKAKTGGRPLMFFDLYAQRNYDGLYSDMSAFVQEVLYTLYRFETTGSGVDEMGK